MSLNAHLPALLAAAPEGWWQPWDTAIVLAAAVTAMSCTLPGVWLVLRQQSMMGDALSHTALPGVVLAFLLSYAAQSAGWISSETRQALEPFILIAGAVLIGMATALLTELVQKLGRVEGSAALGVVFTSLFALGLLLIRLKADDIHLDADCVLFGQLELAVFETVPLLGIQIPMAVLTNGGLLLVNLVLLLLFYKELRLTAFDPEFATAQGIRSSLVNYLLMGITAATVVMAFESVGSILVVALLIVPTACALLLSDRLSVIIPLSLAIAACSAFVGRVLAKSVPEFLFSRLGFPHVKDAGTSGMVAVACGLFFVAAFLFSPGNGLIGRWRGRLMLTLKMAADDVLATLYRFEEKSRPQHVPPEQVRKETAWIGPLHWKVALWDLQRKGLITTVGGLHLTPSGSEQAAQLVRSHRLWESYMQKHFDLPDDHLHESAHFVEHFLDQDLRSQLDEELDSPQLDPHGKSIPEPPAPGPV
ncbi:metal ABC transporter permease [Planctomicrobium sp. SH664]|uniref:metal ABC transporter permease n=1 Tax=Planctomicrobium sp. SH664 TaxID=3448125 RepID=UPI003F5B1124